MNDGSARRTGDPATGGGGVLYLRARRVSAVLARANVDGSPGRIRSIETVSERGAPSIRSTENPNSRLGLTSPHSQGRVMERSLFVGIDVAKDFLDVHVRPTDERWRVAN